MVGLARLVEPVGGDAVVGHGLHLAGADLHLDGHAAGAEQGGMQALVAVCLGDGDIVLETPGHRLVEVMHHAEDAVAAVDILGENPEAEDVHDLVERLALIAHLAIDRQQVLLASDHRAWQPPVVEALLKGVLDLANRRPAVAPSAGNGTLDTLGAHRVQGVKGEVLEFHADGVDAQPAGDAGVDLQGLAGDAPFLLGAQGTEGAHVVQAVGELDDDHPDIPGHRQHHLLEVLRLGHRLVLEGDLGQLGDAIHQFGNRGSELLGQGLLVDTGILDHIMQHGRHQALMVHMHVGEDVGDRQGMGNVGFAGAPTLAVVGLLGIVEGALDLLDLALG